MSTLLRRSCRALRRRQEALLGGVPVDKHTRWPGRARSSQWMWGMLPAVSRLPVSRPAKTIVYQTPRIW